MQRQIATQSLLDPPILEENTDPLPPYSQYASEEFNRLISYPKWVSFDSLKKAIDEMQTVGLRVA